MACALMGSLLAATPEPKPQIDELDEVVVRASKPLPLEIFVEFPRYDSVAISPNGTRLAMGWTNDTFQRQLSVIEFPSLKPLDSHLLQTFLGVNDLRWVSDRRVLVQTDWPARGFRRLRETLGSVLISDPGGRNLQVLNSDILAMADPSDELRRQEAAAAAAARQRKAQRAGSANSSKKADRNALGPVRMIAARTGVPDQALFQTTRSDLNGNTDGYGAFLLNVVNRQQQRVATLPLTNGQFIEGPDHRVALVAGVNAQNERVVYYLPAEARAGGSDWKLVVSSGGGERGLRPVAWTGSGEEYYALDGRNAATRAVVVWNAQSNTQRLLYRHPAADMDNFALDPAGRPWIFWGNDHFPVYWYPDPGHALAQLHRLLTRRQPNEQIDIMNATDDLALAVVRVSSGRRPPVYLVVDVKNARSLTGMNTYPKIRGTRLAPVDPIEFISRDGLVLRGYLTTPEDADDKPRRGLPLVVIAHDGPQDDGADYRYEFERQLFASRGYAVLQVNHRGTPGRGAAFERAGDHKWGREVQDDFADGVRWAIKDGVAAANRVCFYGTGYGAYSAVIAAAREPGLFQCVIGVSGIYDLPRLLDNGKQEIPFALQQGMSDNMEELQARSPVSYASNVKAKVLLMHHGDDDRLPIDQSSRMRLALRAAGNNAQWEPIGQNGGYFTPMTRAGGYTVMLRFLDQNIGH
jgi:dipeptidyl aminopeptidase/acylaminoacyl peptidase